MFDKNKFAKLIKNIKETYISQEEFSKKSGIGRTYLSQYMNAKLDSPPKPKILKRLADSSNGTTSYENLMQVCGYIDNNVSNTINNKLLFLYEKQNTLENMYKNRGDDLTFKESQIAHELFEQVAQDLYKCTPQTFDPDKIVNDIDFISNKSRKKISKALQDDFEYFYYKRILQDQILDLEFEKKKANTDDINEIDDNIAMVGPNFYFIMLPVYGQISAGQPNWAEECIEGKLPIDPNLMGILNPEEHYFLRVNGESMNKVVKNGAFALIHKQDTVENGEIAVVLVNGYDATLKKFTKQGDLVILEPQSDDDNFKTQVYDKNTPIKVLGKYVGKMEFNK